MCAVSFEPLYPMISNEDMYGLYDFYNSPSRNCLIYSVKHRTKRSGGTAHMIYVSANIYNLSRIIIAAVILIFVRYTRGKQKVRGLC